jgi:hypothetical protein
MVTADLLQREEEFYSSLFDSLGLDKCGNFFHWNFDFAVWTQAVV